MRIKALEPQFSIATSRLASAIHHQLIAASRNSRPRWKQLSIIYADTIPEVRRLLGESQQTIHLPVVKGFMLEWARHLEWPLCDPGCCDAIGVEVPNAFINELKQYGTVASFELLLTDTHKTALASLGNNDHDHRFGLIVNCPLWLQLAMDDQWAATFEKQLGVVIHHEMGHFRHQQNGIRSEFLAHSRSVGWALSASAMPPSREAAVACLETAHPDVWYNDEVRRLFAEQGEAAWRLVRLWGNLFQKHGLSRTAAPAAEHS
jgi:hypothetical protein